MVENYLKDGHAKPGDEEGTPCLADLTQHPCIENIDLTQHLCIENIDLTQY